MSEKDILNIAVLASGRGSNLQAIIDKIKDGQLCGVKISLVISDIKEAYALERARNNNIEGIFIDTRQYKREEMDSRIIHILKEREISLICLAGFMRILGHAFVNEFRYKIMNIHPSLLPSFPGLNVQKKAIDYGARVSGCTVHFVDEGVDSGPIIIQAVVPIFQNDTKESLSERILKNEHKIYPLAIKAFKEGRLYIKDRRVFIQSTENDPFQPADGVIFDNECFLAR